MRIGFDQTAALVNHAGTGTYVRQLAKGLAKGLKEDPEPLDVVFFAARQWAQTSQGKTLLTRLNTLYRDLYWMHVQLPVLVKRSNVQILHMPAFIRPLACSCPVVLSIMDTVLYQHPEYFPTWQKNYFTAFGSRSARDAAHIITISEASKQDILRAFQVPPEKVTAIPLAASPQFTTAAGVQVDEVKQNYRLDQYVLTVGSIEPRKNLERIISAFSFIHEAYPNLKLVHVGPYGWRMDDLFEKVKACGLEDCVRFLGKVPIEDLVLLYNGAKAFVFPSLYEGFGLPILEAMACGCPVITSNISSMPEVAGDAALLVDPLSVGEIAQALTRILSDASLAEELRSLGMLQAKKFSWERCTQETIQIYRNV